MPYIRYLSDFVSEWAGFRVSRVHGFCGLFGVEGLQGSGSLRGGRFSKLASLGPRLRLGA